MPEFNALNTELENNGFMKLDKVYFSRGGGLYTIFPKVTHIHCLIIMTYSADKTEGSNTNSVRGTTVGTSLGVVLLNNPKYQLIPLGGIVYSWFMLDYLKNNNSNQTFNDYLGGGLNTNNTAATKALKEILVYTFRLPLQIRNLEKL
jgi:hypothetical protein